MEVKQVYETRLGQSRRCLPDWINSQTPDGVLITAVSSIPRFAKVTRTDTTHGIVARVVHPPLSRNGGRSPYDCSRDWDASHVWTNDDWDEEVLNDNTYTRYLVNSDKEAAELEEYFLENPTARSEPEYEEDIPQEPDEWFDWWPAADERLNFHRTKLG